MKTALQRYCSLLEKDTQSYLNDNTTVYKIIYEELSKSPDAYEYFNALKGTRTYDILKQFGNVDTASDLGEMGF